jgi:methylmalonyl-CoA mutase C-terminal domain/subunit
MEQLRERGAGDIPVFVGGIIPEDDIPGLKEAGVMAVFTPGSPTSDIADAIVQAAGGK